MRSTLAALLIGVLLMPAGLPASPPPHTAATSPAFLKLKTLAGAWKGTDSQGKPAGVTYKVVSAGTAVMETLGMGDEQEMMVTMYHPDGATIMMTHYCSMGNQPRMRSAGLAAGGASMTFTVVDVANLATPKEDHMTALVLTFKDEDHFSQTWTAVVGDTTEHTETFAFERVK